MDDIRIRHKQVMVLRKALNMGKGKWLPKEGGVPTYTVVAVGSDEIAKINAIIGDWLCLEEIFLF